MGKLRYRVTGVALLCLIRLLVTIAFTLLSRRMCARTTAGGNADVLDDAIVKQKVQALKNANLKMLQRI